MNVWKTKTEGGRSAPRSFLGLRVSALVETLAFLAVALIVDYAVGSGDRFSGISPHPFWIIVLLVSTYYGTNEGLFAAGLCAIALLAGNIPEQGFNEERTAWLLRITSDPVLWILAALFLGEISSGRRRKNQELTTSIGESHKQNAAVTEAYELLSEAKASLEVRIAAQGQTLRSVYQASRSIEQQDVAGVVNGAIDFVRAVMAPKKFSLFLLNGDELSIEAKDGWGRTKSFSKRSRRRPRCSRRWSIDAIPVHHPSCPRGGPLGRGRPGGAYRERANRPGHRDAQDRRRGFQGSASVDRAERQNHLRWIGAAMRTLGRSRLRTRGALPGPCSS